MAFNKGEIRTTDRSPYLFLGSKLHDICTNTIHEILGVGGNLNASYWLQIITNEMNYLQLECDYMLKDMPQATPRHRDPNDSLQRVKTRWLSVK